MTASAHQLFLVVLLSFHLSHAFHSSALWTGRRAGNRCEGTALCPHGAPTTNQHWRVLGVPRQTVVRLSSSTNPDDQENKLSKLGYTPQELKSSASRQGETKEDASVNVNLVEDIDAVTLTAVGFGLIAINFFIFANMGDGGLGGVVAKIINLSRQ